MFDFEAKLLQWRRETEATLAFEDNEIDELEDHLRLAIETGLKEGLPPEQAWQHAQSRLGPASSLAPEFTKSKLMPALFHLVRSGWQAALLILIFSGVLFAFCDFTEGRSYRTFIAGYLGLAAMLFFIPGKPLKNAVLLGVGIAFCLIPLLHVLFYNPLTEKIVGYGWIRMGASFGWMQIGLGLLGIVLLTVWWWKRMGTEREKLPAQLSVAASLIFLLGL
jgi:hypothetical protein